MTAKIEPGRFKIAFADNDDTALTVGNDSQVKAKGDAEGAWDLERAGDGEWNLIYRDQGSKYDGQALHLDKPDNDRNILVHTKDGSKNQLWKLIHNEDGKSYKVLSCLGDGRLDMGVQFLITGGGPGPVVIGGYNVVALDVTPVSKNSVRDWTFTRLVL